MSKIHLLISDKVTTLTHDLGIDVRRLRVSPVLVERAGLNASAVAAERDRPGRIRDYDTVQAMKRIFRTANLYQTMKEIARDTKAEVNVFADRIDASEYAWQAKISADPHEKLELLLVAEKLYARALSGIPKLNVDSPQMDEMAHHVQRSLDAVRQDVDELEQHIMKDIIEQAKMRIKELDIISLSAETERNMHRLMREFSIERIKYKILAAACYVGFVASTTISIVLPPTQTFTIPIATGAFAWGGRMWWKARSFRTKRLTVQEALEDRRDRLACVQPPAPSSQAVASVQHQTA